MYTRLLVVLLGAFLLLQVPAYAQFDETFSKPLDTAIEEAMEQYYTPGLAISIVHDGKEVYARAFGIRNAETKAPLATTDLFHWASVTKPFVAAAAMILVEQGKLDLDAPVTDYLPYFKMNDPAYTKITSRMLLTHTAGMPDVSDYKWDKPKYGKKELEKWVREIGGRKLLFPPSTKSMYSNIGFEVMGDVIAKASGMSFEDFVAQHIFEPLKMTKATLLIKDTDPKDRVTPHSVTRRAPRVRKTWPYNRRHAPSSTLIANVHDMGRWAIANLNRGTLDGTRLLQEDAYEQLFNSTMDIAPNQGLSWELGTTNGHQFVRHSGSDTGFASVVMLVPDLNLGIAIVSNTDRPPLGTVMRLAMGSAIEAAATD